MCVCVCVCARGRQEGVWLAGLAGEDAGRLAGGRATRAGGRAAEAKCLGAAAAAGRGKKRQRGNAEGGAHCQTQHAPNQARQSPPQHEPSLALRLAPLPADALTGAALPYLLYMARTMHS